MLATHVSTSTYSSRITRPLHACTPSSKFICSARGACPWIKYETSGYSRCCVCRCEGAHARCAAVRDQARFGERPRLHEPAVQQQLVQGKPLLAPPGTPTHFDAYCRFITAYPAWIYSISVHACMRTACVRVPCAAALGLNLC